MPTARELLEQADALMRRNRKRGKGRLGDVPTLTAALGVDADTSLAPTVMLAATQGVGADPVALNKVADVDPHSSDLPVDTDPISLDTLSDLPVLTDAVLEWPPRTPSPDESAVTDEPVVDAAGDAFPTSAVAAEGAAARLPPPTVLEQEASEVPAAQTEEGPAEADAFPPAAPAVDDDFILEIPPAEEGAAPAAAEDSPIAPIAAPAALSPGSREWDALAEEIRMQVLQRLDLFTDTGLRDQLGARLQPIVDRASAQLVETINRELGELVRGYVAEAIEREIDSWRSRST